MSRLKSVRKTHRPKPGIVTWMSFQLAAIALSSLLSLLFVLYAARFFYGVNLLPIGYALGILLPMALILSGVNISFFLNLMKYITVLSEAINEVTQGNFDVRLNESRGIFRESSIGFNKMCAELHSVSMLRNDFVNSYSHEFKTPITSINGFAELLLVQDISEEDRNKYLHIIADESARLADLANNTILLAKIDSQEIVEDKELYRLDEQIKRCAIMLAQSWGNKNINLVCDMQEAEFFGNAQLMYHLWSNLLSNAIKYTPEYGDITVTLRKANGKIKVKFADTGIGMSSETVAHAFDKYYRGDKTHPNQGLGLGLSIVKRIVELCEGKVSVESKEDEGSTFTVTLPDHPTDYNSIKLPLNLSQSIITAHTGSKE